MAAPALLPEIMIIQNISAREILDSRGDPTVEATIKLKNGLIASASVPAGVSTGVHEALELRNGDLHRFGGKGVLKAIKNVNQIIGPMLEGLKVTDQQKIDQLMIETDATENKSNLGANAILSVSMAVCKSAANWQRIPLYQYFGQLSGNLKFTLPQPQILLLEGGRHGNWSTDCQEYFAIPKREKFTSFAQMLRAGAEMFQALGKILNSKKYGLGVGFEGAYMPDQIKSNEEALELILKAIEKAGYKSGKDVVLGLDAAASEFFQKGQYVLKSEGEVKLTARQWTEKVIAWTKKYPLWSIEDIHGQEMWNEWVYFTSQVGREIQVIGDDLLATNMSRIQKAIELQAVNSVLIKLNQIGTVTETIKAINQADKAQLTTVISHRGGETNDDMIADLVVGTTSWQCKFGAPSRGERVAKYNRLLAIEEELIKS